MAKILKLVTRKGTELYIATDKVVAWGPEERHDDLTFIYTTEGVAPFVVRESCSKITEAMAGSRNHD